MYINSYVYTSDYSNEQINSICVFIFLINTDSKYDYEIILVFLKNFQNLIISFYVK